MTPKMQEALDKLANAGNMPKSAFHHSTVTALLKGSHVEEVPGDSAWITLAAVKSEDLPQRDPAVPVIPINDEVIGAVRHVDFISTVATPKAWIRGCPSCKMPLVDNPAHLPGCEVALVQEVLTDQGLPPVALNVEQLVTLISDVQREDAERVAEAPAHLPGCEVALPQVAVPGYRWRWFNPQGGQSVSTTTIQLMADGDDLSPSAILLRNADGTWRAERGHRWGMSALIAGTYQGSLSMEECARAVVAEAALREPAERVAEAPAWRCRDRVKATRVSRRRAQRGAMAR